LIARKQCFVTSDHRMYVLRRSSTRHVPPTSTAPG
jgi:hypothetical protein